MKKVIKNNIMQIRKEKGLTQKEVISKIKISEPTLRAVEQNIFSSSLGTLTKIAYALGVDVKDLFEDAAKLSEEEMKAYRLLKMINEIDLEN